MLCQRTCAARCWKRISRQREGAPSLGLVRDGVGAGRASFPRSGTTRAGYFHGSVSVTSALGDGEISPDCEQEANEVIARGFGAIDYAAVPRVLDASQGPFTGAGRDDGCGNGFCA